MLNENGSQTLRAAVHFKGITSFFASSSRAEKNELIWVDMAGSVEKEIRIKQDKDFLILDAEADESFFYLTGVEMDEGKTTALILKLNKSNRSQQKFLLNDSLNSWFNAVCFHNGDIVAVGWKQESDNRRQLMVKLSTQLSLQEEILFGNADHGVAMDVQSSGNSLFIFGHEYFDLNRDLSVSKFENEELKWHKNFGSSAYEEAQNMIITSDQSLVLAAHMASIDPLHNAYCLKLDFNGNIIWEKQFGGAAHDGCEAVIEAQDRSLIFVTRSESFDIDSDVYVLKLDPGGTLITEQLVVENGINEAYELVEQEDNYLLLGGQKDDLNADEDIHFITITK